MSRRSKKRLAASAVQQQAAKRTEHTSRAAVPALSIPTTPSFINAEPRQAARPAEPERPSVVTPESPRVATAPVGPKGVSFASRLLDAVLPSRMARRQREYDELASGIARLQREIEQIIQLQETLAGSEPPATQSERSVRWLREQATGNDLVEKQKEIAALRAQVSELTARYPRLAHR